nr:retrovirus-related Pol polyprotein from transposon TNT 1-94 [Tanacetum cinerariifolium]
MISLRLIPLVSKGYVTIKAVSKGLMNSSMSILLLQVYKSVHNVDFHPMVDFIEASPLRIETTKEGTKILATVDGILRTVTESSLRRNLKLKDEDGISSLLDTKLFENLTLMGYNISPNQKFTFQKADKPTSTLRDASQGEACPTDSGFIADQDRAPIAKSSTLPYDSAPRVTSPTTDEGSIQQTINELMAFCTSLQRQHSELLAKFQAQEVEINRLKERVKLLEDRDGVAAERSGDDFPIKGRYLDEGEAAAERVSNDSEEMTTILTFIDAATVLAGGIADVPTGSGSIPTASPPADEVPTGSDVAPTASLVFATATMVTLYRRRKGKEVMVEFDTPKKQIVQEQIDAQVARELEEQLEREDQRRSEQIARDAEIVTGEAKSPDEVLKEKIKEMMQLVPIEEVYVEAFQVKHLIIDWKVHSEAKDKEIFMLVEKDYPLRKGLALVMISYKLQVENYLRMANDLILKIYKISSTPKQQGRIVGNKMQKAFPLPGILHQTSFAQTPEQNGVVERQNRTLKEAARTMLSAVKVPLFFWAEVIATTCFTQNCSLVIPRHEKTPYHIINDQKPSVKFFYIFRSLFYIVRDGKNLDKMKEKGDACIFVGYSTQSRAYRVVSKSFDVSTIDIPNQCQHQHTTPLNNQTTSDPTCQVPTLSPTIASTENINQVEMIAKNAQVANDEFINIFCTPIQDRGETSSCHVDSSNIHTFYQRYPSKHRWTKDHPLEQVIGNPSQLVRTRRQL